MRRALHILAVAVATGLAAAAAPAHAVPITYYDDVVNGVIGVPVDPRLRILLAESSVQFESALTQAATSLTTGLIYAQTTTNPLFTNPDGPGPDALVFTIMGDVPIVIPEPGTAALVALGLLGLVRAGRVRL